MEFVLWTIIAINLLYAVNNTPSVDSRIAAFCFAIEENDDLSQLGCAFFP